MLVHCPSRLGAAAAVSAAEFRRGDGVFATLARERDQAVHHLDGVMSHSFNSSPLSRYDSEPKLLRVESASTNVPVLWLTCVGSCASALGENPFTHFIAKLLNASRYGSSSVLAAGRRK